LKAFRSQKNEDSTWSLLFPHAEPLCPEPSSRLGRVLLFARMNAFLCIITLEAALF
jgi:hypothetical protein